MPARRTTWFYLLLVAVASTAIGMVLASRLDLASHSVASGPTAPPPMNSAPLTGPVDAQTFRNVASAVSPIVVNIRTESTQRRGSTELFDGDDMFRRFFGGEPRDRPRRNAPRERVEGAGSGFIIDKAGFILTNNHVVEGALGIEIGFFGGAPDDYYPAKVVGRDPLTDSALIQLTRLPTRELPVARFGDSDLMQPGDWVMAIGNPFNFEHSISVGVISGLGRPLDVADGRRVNTLQTDAAINPGNSGGPMLNIRGEVVGVNTAILTARANNLGIGFAVPINVIREIIPQLREGRVTRGVIGIRIHPLPSVGFEDFGLTRHVGALVAAVDPEGPASRAGLQPGDVIVEFGGREVRDDGELVDLVTRAQPGARVAVRILRHQKPQTMQVVIGELRHDQDERQPRRETTSSRDPESGGIGVTLDEVPPELVRRLRLQRVARGALIADIEPQSAAEGALLRGDVIIEINDRRVANAADAAKQLEAVPQDRLARLLVLRDGQRVFVPVRK
ncbi:MAG: PDZ domain-containing protein [Luteitalea sp.]|nr:PDZ domain-containing protein [Luteitalea sp.]